MWPNVVNINEIQSRLINDGVPVDRAMHVTSAVGQVPAGGRYRIEREQGDLYLYALNTPGYFAVASE